MIPTKQQVLSYAMDKGLPCSSAALDLVQNCTKQELVYDCAGRLTESANKEARRLVTEHRPGLTPEQASLFELHSSLPAIVRVEADGGDEMFVHWQNASLDQHLESIRWKRAHHLQQAGICERQEKRIYDLDVDRDIALGYLIFADTECAICHRPWIENDPLGPFEQAHDQPVAGRSGDASVRWAHRKCNQLEGA